MSPCPDAGEKLSAYIDGELQPEERRSLCRHLKTCTACRHALTTVTTIKEMVTRTAAVYPLPPTLRRVLPLASLPSRRLAGALLALFRRRPRLRRRPQSRY